VPARDRPHVLVAGGGIGGLTTALALHERGIACEVHEASRDIRELGVGINTLPHAIRELRDLGLLEELDRRAIRTAELFLLTRRGQEVWREPRGLDAGHDVPQLSIHRGVLQGVILRAVRERLGPGAVRTASRLVSFAQDADGVEATFDGPAGRERVRADALVGADGIHSTVRRALYPAEGPPRWNGTMLFRGATEWPAFLTGRSMIIAGGMEAKLVLYPIGGGARPDTRLTNWAVQLQQGEEGPPPVPQSWSRAGRLADLEPHLERFAVDAVDLLGLARATAEIWEFPMCDRDPLERWTHGRITLLGDAAHPMYPVGSNGASQAILDARVLADELAARDDVPAALAAYDAVRRPATAAIVHANRSGGPEGVIDAVERLAPDGFDDVDAVLPHADRAAIVQGYAAQSVSGGATGSSRSVA
jgi:2-polyprenyl-6-methoxyphenol hydroxylase-like FAD-dependent oxidoreductase